MVDRWEPCFLEEYDWTPIEKREDGDYVLFDDYERLRRALEEIASGTTDKIPPYRCIGAEQMKDIARKALEG